MMKFCSFLYDDEIKLGVIVNDCVIDLYQSHSTPEFSSMLAFIQAGDQSHTLLNHLMSATDQWCTYSLDQIQLLAPLMPSTVLCSGSNYRAHNAEKANAPTSGKEPEFFVKTADSVVGPDDGIIFDPLLTQKLDCETELAIVIGRTGRHIPIASAIDYVFGYTIANDVTARDRQVRYTPEGFVFYELGRGKAFDSSLPLGPVVVSAKSIPDPQQLLLSTRINGELRQQAHTHEMIWSCAELIHFFSINFTLKPGMVILTGTPGGTAWSVDAELGGQWQPSEHLVPAERYCLPGDIVESEIEHIGILKNTVIKA